MKKELDYTIPPGLDLGNVVNAPVGAEIAVIHRCGGNVDTFKVAACIAVVSKDDGWRLLLRNPENERTSGAVVKARNGASPYFTRSSCFYYSANPTHVALAKRKIRAAKRREDKRKAAFNAKLEVARPVGEALGDGWKEGEDGEYRSGSVAVALVEKLTAEQIKQLAGWLGI